MLKRLKQYLFIGMLIAGVYFLLSRHIIFHGTDFFLLEKEHLNLEYTFFSVKDKKASSIISIDPLRRAGIGDILVDLHIITADEHYKLEYFYEHNSN